MRDDVEKAFRRASDPNQPQSTEEALTAKLSILNEMIVQDILLAKARALKIEVPASELDAKFNDAKKNLTDDQFQQELKKRNLTADDMREGLRRELLENKLIEQEVTSKVAVSDQEITDFFNANKAQFNLPEEAYHLAQIVITPHPGEMARLLNISVEAVQHNRLQHATALSRDELDGVVGAVPKQRRPHTRALDVPGGGR